MVAKAQVRRELLRHLSGLEIAVGALPDAPQHTAVEIREQEFMLGRLDGVLQTWKAQLTEAKLRKA